MNARRAQFGSLVQRIVGGVVVEEMRATNVTVRWNDLRGNRYAGLRIAANQNEVIDAVEAGAAFPAFTPFATAPIAGTAQTSCAGGM